MGQGEPDRERDVNAGAAPVSGDGGRDLDTEAAGGAGEEPADEDDELEVATGDVTNHVPNALADTDDEEKLGGEQVVDSLQDRATLDEDGELVVPENPALGGIVPVSTARMALMRPAIPAAALRCPI